MLYDASTSKPAPADEEDWMDSSLYARIQSLRFLHSSINHIVNDKGKGDNIYLKYVIILFLLYNKKSLFYLYFVFHMNL